MTLSYWVWVDPKVNDRCPYEKKTQAHREECCVTMGRDGSVAPGVQGATRPGGGRQGCFLELRGEP